jgi:hypothetical protein
MERLVAELGLAAGLPPARFLDAKQAGPGRYVFDLDAPDDGLYEVAVWYTADPSAGGVAEYSLTGRDGTTATALDQRIWGSRWIKLGDVALSKGSGTVTVSGAPDAKLVPGRLRVTRWARPPG